MSGIGWGLGYAGGLLALVVALVALVQPEMPWFGFSKEGAENIRATNLLVAVWFLVFSLPTFLVLHEDKSRVSRRGKVMREAYQQLRETFVEIRRYRQIVRLLLARLFYNDGLITIFAFGGIYAAGTFGFTFEEILVFGIALNVAAGAGAFALGWVDDRIGGKRTITISLWGLIAVGAARGVGAQQSVVLGGGDRRRDLRRPQSVGEPLAARPLRSARQGERVLRLLRVLRQGHRVPRTLRARHPDADCRAHSAWASASWWCCSRSASGSCAASTRRRGSAPPGAATPSSRPEDMPE